MKELIELAQNLMRVKSVTPEDGGLIKWIGSWLEKLGFKSEYFEFGRVKNLYAKLGDGPYLCFAGHVDTVPPGYTWSHDPYSSTIEDGFLYGRGAVDMKAAIACAMMAFKNISNENKSLAFLLTSDEEGEAENGIKKVAPILKARNENIGLFILGEPTCDSKAGDKVKIGRRGSITAKIEFLGKQGHIAYPELADNPMPRLSNCLQELISLDFEDEDPVFGKSKLQVTAIETGNPTENLIPGIVSMMFGIRFNPKQTEESIKTKIENILNKHAKPYRAEWHFHGNPFLMHDEHIKLWLQHNIKEVCDINPIFDAKGATSDGRFLHSVAPVVEIGLHEDLAHKVDEKVGLNDLKILYEIYKKLALTFPF